MAGAEDDATDLAALLGDPLVRGFGVILEVTARLERLVATSLEREFGISHTMFEVLLRLAEAPDRRLPVGELGRLLVVTSGGATRLVNRMAERDLVHRRTSPIDRRVQIVEMTDHGADVLRRAAAVHAAHLRELLGEPLPAEELTRMFESLDRLGAALRERLPYLH
ncbi:MarR family transcriptional regulator [Longimycelium tulufanense]|uniref:MarR family transcriptional regulator n=1 Tax=Longimycelium tulufanense TaxID=907463 RepID=A0A8J3FTZ1_9PSEU|nr:MarR family transcriptional regulator [Longimycelium tulufanense]GGM45608.1 MarR family transcriptional regulator [Longimycelium tulufanense]